MNKSTRKWFTKSKNNYFIKKKNQPYSIATLTEMPKIYGKM